MSTLDLTFLLLFPDLVARNIVRNRMTLARWMNRDHNPFPRPISLGRDKDGKPAGRVAWRASDVEAWLERCAAESQKVAA